ncbi:uncharacterized protein [Phaseolus vulgaris]|uniref:uncharacterized protein n=1 Tax=Phaseolus vulgaris TaxID=3885 RepID=UPI0035CC2B59
MAAFGVVPRSLPVFDGKDYDDLIVKMEAILGFQELEEAIKIWFQDSTKLETEEQKKNSEKQSKENKKIDCKARMLLHQCVSAAIFQKISKAKSAKHIWDILEQTYGNTGRVKKVRLQSLRRQFELLSMTDQESVCDYFVAIEESKDLDEMTVEELQNSLEAHEQRLLSRKVECWGADNSNNTGNLFKKDEAHLAQEDEDSDLDQVLLMATTNQDEDASSWYLDTGCSNHMTGNRKWIIDFDSIVKNSVRFAYNSMIFAEGIGKVRFTCKDGRVGCMNDVVYVPSMKNNLLSLG